MFKVDQQTEKQRFDQIEIDKLQRNKSELMSHLIYLKQRIQQVELQQNAAIREVRTHVFFQFLYYYVFIIATRQTSIVSRSLIKIRQNNHYF